MKENLEKELRRFLKRRKKITEAVIVCFLITGGIGYGEMLGIDTTGNFEIKADENYDQVNIESNDVTLEVKGSVTSKGYLLGGDYTDNLPNLGSGIVLDNGLLGITINNYGRVTGAVSFKEEIFSKFRQKLRREWSIRKCKKQFGIYKWIFKYKNRGQCCNIR